MLFLSIHSSPLGKQGEKDTGGMSTYLRGLASALGAAGQQVDLVTRAVNPNEPDLYEISPFVRLINLDDGLGPLTKNELYPHCRHIAEVVDRYYEQKDMKCSMIFSHYWLSGLVGQILADRWQVPHLVMFHTMGRAKNEAASGENEPQQRLQSEAELARSAHTVITAAVSEKKRVLSYYNLPRRKVAVIPCGIDRTLFRPLAEKEAKEKVGAGSEKIILFVGRIEPVKGLDLLLEAAALLPAEDNFSIYIVGGDERSNGQVAYFKEKAAALSLSDRLLFKGTIKHEELPAFYSAASVTVLPSYYESFGLVSLESLACGTPVVAGPVGVIPELFSAAGNSGPVSLMDDRNPASWAGQIRRYLLQPRSATASGYEHLLAPYSWPSAAAELIRFYNERLKGKRRQKKDNREH